MRNRKLFNLKSAAEKAFGELTTYLGHLDKRETDPSYVHARMLFDEGWRMSMTLPQTHLPHDEQHLPFRLWMSADEAEGDVSPVVLKSVNRNDATFLKALQLSSVPSTVEILTFLMEITEEEVEKN